MSTLRTLGVAAFAMLVLAAAADPAGSSANSSGCGPATVIRDPVLRASFAHFDRNQTSVATRLCADFRNDMDRLGNY